MPVIPCQCVSSWNQGLLGGDYFWSQWEQLYWLVISVDSFMHFQLAPGSFMDRTYFWSQWEQLYGLTSVWILSCIFSWHQGLSWMDIIFRHNESRYIVSSVWILSWIFSWHQVFLKCRSSLVTMRAVMWFVTSVVSFMRFQLVPGPLSSMVRFVNCHPWLSFQIHRAWCK